jgi:hypothetical protein
MDNILPQCIQSMGCWCACHAAGMEFDEPCDTDESRARTLATELSDDDHDDHDEL